MGKKNKKKGAAPANMSDPESLKSLGNEEFQKGNFTEAIEFYTKAIEIND